MSPLGDNYVDKHRVRPEEDILLKQKRRPERRRNGGVATPEIGRCN